MKFFYTFIMVVGLFLLLSWAPYQGEYDPWWGAANNYSGLAASEFAIKHWSALSAVLIGLSIIGLVRENTIGRMRKMLEPAPLPSIDRMRFFYASLVAVGLILLLAWLPYRVRVTHYPPWEVPMDARMAVRELADLQRLALSAVLIGLPVIGLVRESRISRMRKMVERAASPNGGPGTPLDNSGVSEGPPSVS